MEDFDGVFPDNEKDILKLPGVGSYTAGAILSIAFNTKIAAVDGNVMRVYSRYYNLDYDISVAKSKKLFEEKVYDTLPEDRRHFNQAIMELGARVCTPKNYKCDACPIKEGCQAYALDLQDCRPIKSKKIKKKHANIAACMVHCNGKVLLTKRPPEGLLAGMWTFPLVNTDGDETIQDSLLEDYNVQVKDLLDTARTKHVYTHLVWDMTLYEMVTDQAITSDMPIIKWVSLEELNTYALPKGIHKLLENRKKDGYQISFC